MLRAFPKIVEGESPNDEGEIVTIKVEEESEEDKDVEADCKLIGILRSMEDCCTIKIEGSLKDVGMVVLIDRSASHNFISQKLTSTLGLKVTPMVAKGKKLRDGPKVFSVGVCKGIRITLESHVFVLDAMVLELGGVGRGDGSIVVEHSRKGSHGLEKFNHAILASGSIDINSRSGSGPRKIMFTQHFPYKPTFGKLRGLVVQGDSHRLLDQFPPLFQEQIQLPRRSPSSSYQVSFMRENRELSILLFWKGVRSWVSHC